MTPAKADDILVKNIVLAEKKFLEYQIGFSCPNCFFTTHVVKKMKN